MSYPADIQNTYRYEGDGKWPTYAEMLAARSAQVDPCGYPIPFTRTPQEAWAKRARDEALAEAGRELQRQAVDRFDKHGPSDVRGAALWDAACMVVEEMGDGDWRKGQARGSTFPGSDAPPPDLDDPRLLEATKAAAKALSRAIAPDPQSGVRTIRVHVLAEAILRSLDAESPLWGDEEAMAAVLAQHQPSEEPGRCSCGFWNVVRHEFHQAAMLRLAEASQ